jgi:hypothetical protein
MRAKLFKDYDLSIKFLKAIINAYQEVIVPWWPAKVVHSICDPKLGAKITSKKFTKEELERLHRDYVLWEKTPRAKPEKII